MMASVEIVEKVSDSDYDRILESHVVFIKLFDASAVNTVIECCVRNTPILINKLPAVVEILGENYPFYFSSLEEASEKLNYGNVLKTHLYLKTLDKKKLQIDTFVDQFTKIVGRL